MSDAKIFLAYERGLHETTFFRSECCFGNHQTPNKRAKGNVFICNEETLGALQSISFTVEQESNILFLPLVGNLLLLWDEKEITVNVGELFIGTFKMGDNFEIKNEHPHELINYLQIHQSEISTKYDGQILQLDFENGPNSLISFTNELYIGKYEGRIKGELQFPPNYNYCFSFVVSGVFECEERLLHYRDGLEIWNTNKIEFEALANESILLLFFGKY